MSPLLGGSIGLCSNCGANKVFEMQLLPTLLHFLRCDRSSGISRGAAVGDDDDPLSLIDFGTALVFSCEKSCWNEGAPKLMMETVVLQGEPGKEFGVVRS